MSSRTPIDGPVGNVFRTQDIEWRARLQGVALASFRSRALAFLIDGAIVVVDCRAKP